MLKMNLTIKIHRKLRGKCPRHPGYNPEGGEGKIRGNCQQCRALFEVTKARDLLHEAAARFDELAKPYEVERKKHRAGQAEDSGSEEPLPFSLSSPTVSLTSE